MENKKDETISKLATITKKQGHENGTTTEYWNNVVLKNVFCLQFMEH